jgi:hypothetical protein
MNQHITILGLVVLLIGIGFTVYPLVLTGAEQLDSEVEAGVFVLPVGVTVILWGAASPDPSVTTVGGVFGNPDEELVRQWENRRIPARDPRFIPNPRETLNCSQCYTAIPPEELRCPRCGKDRECRTCGGKISRAYRVTQCVGCGREEVYCSCAKVKRSGHSGRGGRGRLR